MFSGIVTEIGRVLATRERSLVIAARDSLSGLVRGGSIAVNGVCLTVTEFNSDSFSVDVMPETLKRTDLGSLRPGARVNLERPLLVNGELGGHLVQGHVDGTGQVEGITREGEAALVSIVAPPEIMRYTVPKGFIAVDGVSLTIVDKSADSFRVSLVGYTRRNTVLGERRVGGSVNLEVDIIAKYVAEFLPKQDRGLTMAFLQEHGFAAG